MNELGEGFTFELQGVLTSGSYKGQPDRGVYSVEVAWDRSQWLERQAPWASLSPKMSPYPTAVGRVGVRLQVFLDIFGKHLSEAYSQLPKQATHESPPADPDQKGPCAWTGLVTRADEVERLLKNVVPGRTQVAQHE
jgi:hypothetical protein